MNLAVFIDGRTFNTVTAIIRQRSLFYVFYAECLHLWPINF